MDNCFIRIKLCVSDSDTEIGSNRTQQTTRHFDVIRAEHDWTVNQYLDDALNTQNLFTFLTDQNLLK